MNPAIICDPGTGYMKMGYAGDNFPKATFASLIGRPMLRCQQFLGQGVELKQIMIGNEASKYRSLLQLSHPTSEGIVRNWQDMRLLMDYSFKQIHADPANSAVFMTEAAMNPVANKMNMMEMLFEGMHVGKVQYGMQALMSLYAEGCISGLLLDSGDGVTHCISVSEGNILKHSFERLDIAGRHVTEHLLKLLCMRGYPLNSTSDFETVREIKEKYCFVSGDFKVDMKMAKETSIHEKIYKLPDGNEIKIGKERFIAPELLFNPGVDGRENSGCAQMVFETINKCQMSLRKQFYSNILLSGGTSMLPGFPTRFKNEMQKLFSAKLLGGASIQTSSVKIKIVDPPTRKYNVFIGASIVAKQYQAHPQQWITRQTFREEGKNRIANRFKY